MIIGKQQEVLLTNHGEDIRRVRRSLVSVTHLVFPMHHESLRQAKVGSEGVQEDGTARVDGLE